MAHEDLNAHSLRLSNHRAFGEEPQGFGALAPVNLLVGRNNAGKSSLLDAIAFLCGDEEALGTSRAGAEPQLLIESSLNSTALGRVFQKNTSEGSIRGNHEVFARPWLEGEVAWTLSASGQRGLVSIAPPIEGARGVHDAKGVQQMFGQVVQGLAPPFKGMSLLRVASDRDVRPEPAGEAKISPSGEGATASVQKFLYDAHLDRDLVRVNMLRDLNEIFNPDAEFTEIAARHRGDVWEIYLGNPDGSIVPLSASGSGLRTVLLLLSQIHLAPAISGKPLSKFVLALEELENNLHPALQRRLMAYVARVTKDSNLTTFLTTHSHAVIDFFAGDPMASITHVQRVSSDSLTQPVTEHGHRAAILDDLDVRASDLLQANGVIWVEGPSDRLYMNRWIDLMSGGELREGAHYQCVPYGGRLLAHLSADTESSDGLVKILNINRNCFLVIDSDRGRPQDPLNLTKERLIQEVQEVGGGTWVTAGREIENYLSPASISKVLGLEEPPRAVGRYNRFAGYLDGLAPGAGGRYLKSKVTFAGQIVDHIDDTDISRHDLAERLQEVVDSIRVWNRLN